MKALRENWLATLLGVIILSIIAVLSAQAAAHPQQLVPRTPTSDQVAVHVSLPGPGHPAEITVSCHLLAAGQLVIDAAQTGTGGYTRVELYDSVTQNQRHQVLTWNASSSAVADDDVTVYVSTNGGVGFTTYTFTDIQPRAGGPANLQASVGDCSATLTWDPVAGAEGYRIYKRIGTAGRLNQITSVLGDTLDYQMDSHLYQDITLHDGCVFYNPVSKLWHWIGIYNDGRGWEQGSSDRFVNFSSPDLATWTTHEEILNTHLAGDDYKIDDQWIYNVWACQVIERSGYFWMFFTGVDRMYNGTWPSEPFDWQDLAGSGASPQRIFLARAPITADITQPDVWEEVGMMVGSACPNYGDTAVWGSPTLWDPDINWRTHLRDPYVIWDRFENQWIMAVTCGPDDGQDEGVGILYAPTMQGPWTWKGYLAATTSGRTESAYLLERLGGYSLFARISSTELFVATGGLTGDGYAQPYTGSGPTLAEPWPFTIMGADTVRARPYKDCARGSLYMRSSESSQVFPGVTIDYIGEGVSNYESKAQLQRFETIDIVEGETFTDTNLSDGYDYGYAVKAVGGGGMSAITQVSALGTTEIDSLHFYISDDGSAFAIHPDWDMAPWRFRYKSEFSLVNDPATELADNVWSTWEDVQGRIRIGSDFPAWTSTQIGYALLQVEVKSQSSSADYDDMAYASFAFEPPPPQPQNLTGGYQSGPDEMQLDWDDATHPNFLRYVVIETYNPGSGWQAAVEYDAGSVSAWTRSNPPSGDYIYLVCTEATVYGETVRSNPAATPVVTAVP